MTSIKSKYLLAQTTTILVTVLLLGSLGYTLVKETLTRSQQEHLTFVAQSSAREIEAFLQNQKEHLQQIETTAYYQHRGDLPLAKYFSENQKNFPVLTYLNQQGGEELTLINGKVAELPSHRRSSTLFETALAHPNQVFLSPLVYSPDLEEPVIWATFAHVLYFGDVFVGALAGAIPLSQITRTFADQQIGRQGFVGLINTAGDILYLPQQANTTVTKSAISGPDAPAFTASLHQNQAVFGQLRLQEKDCFVAAVPTPTLGGAVLAILPADEFTAAPHRLRRDVLLAGVMILLGGTLIASLLANRLSGNIRKVIAHTELVSNGDLESKLAITSGDEVERLARSFNAMTERLLLANHSREALSTILQSIVDPLLVTDCKGNIIQFNRAATHLFGYSDAEFSCKRITDLLCPDDPWFKGNQRERLCQNGPLRNHETQVRTRDGRAISVLFSCSPLDIDHPNNSGVVGIIKDISDRKEAEEARIQALAEAEAAHEKIAAILSSVADGLLVVDLNERIVLINQKTEQYLNIKPSTQKDRPLDEVITNEKLALHLRAAVSTDSPQDHFDLPSAEMIRDESRILHVRTAPVTNRNGEKTGIITIFHDVTRERQLEQRKNEFISTAAHELRTPLTSVMGFAELLVGTEIFGEVSSDDRQEYVHEIYAKSVVLAKIINDLLDVSRIETGRPIPLELQINDLGIVAAGVVRHFQQHAPNHQVSLDIEASADTLARFDRDKIVQVLENLLSNAIKYSPAGGPVTLRINSQDDQIVACVEDRGMGMTSEQVTHVFDKFYRADFSENTIRGLGLGMSIVHSIIKNHNGSIWVESKLNQGTRAYFTLPKEPADTPFPI